jgi:hypothetical protein
MNLVRKLGCCALVWSASLHFARADDITTVDQLPDYTVDPTYDPSQDPLHGFCYGTAPACYDNGAVTPDPIDPPKFGFTISPGPQYGNYLVDLLVPVNEVVNPASLTFGLNENQGGISDTSTVTVTAGLYSTQAWSSGSLASYLGFSASPRNPISAWLPYTQANGDPGATGYYVYVADIGWTTLQPDSGWASGPLLSLQQGLPTASLIVGFLDTSKGDVATANSSALFIGGSPPPVPEPGGSSAFCMTLAGLAAGVWAKRKA